MLFQDFVKHERLKVYYKEIFSGKKILLEKKDYKDYKDCEVVDCYCYKRACEVVVCVVIAYKVEPHIIDIDENFVSRSLL